MKKIGNTIYAAIATVVIVTAYFEARLKMKLEARRLNREIVNNGN
jgi:hypothetical protein